jgi:acetoacetyl-CoA synthetase
MKDESTTTMREMLTTIWQRVLQHPSIDVDDNFFDLGGDSSLALQLFNEIAETCGRELPPVMIYHASTIASLAALLEQSTPPRCPPVVLLKAGGKTPPVFITHGLGGSVIDFFQVIKHMQCPNPIYGMQAKGVDGADEPFEDITDMARFYLEAINEIQPRGPYLLVGYSLGGLVTLEMAQLLRARGEEVALLAMLDSYPHMRYLVPMQRLRQHLRLAKRSASLVMKLPIRDAIAYLTQRSQRRLRIPGDRNGKARYQSPSAISPVIQRVRESAHAALTRYQPRFYNGRIKFVRAEITTDFPDDPIAVWSKLTRGVEVETVSGDHLEIITTHFEHLASILSRYLREAQG